MAAECLATYREVEQVSTGETLVCLAEIARRQGNGARAKGLCGEALTLFRGLNSKKGLASGLVELAAVLGTLPAALPIRDEQAIRAAWFFGAAEMLRDKMGTVVHPPDRAAYDALVAAARAGIDDATWNAAWAEGRAMRLEQAIAYALEDVESA